MKQINAYIQPFMATIQKSAHTSHHGDGMIFVVDVADTMDIRTGVAGVSIL